MKFKLHINVRFINVLEVLITFTINAFSRIKTLSNNLPLVLKCVSNIYSKTQI